MNSPKSNQAGSDSGLSSESNSLTLGSSSSSGSEEEDNESESDSDEYTIVDPPQTRTLPERATRGQRLRTLRGEDVDVDTQFWAHDTWEEEADDLEWSTDDEGRYRDKFDSDFLASDSPEEEGSADEQRGRDADKSLKRQEAKSNRKKFDYEAVVKRRALKKERSTKVWSVLDPRFVSPARTKGRKAKIITQATLMAEAKRTAETNLQLQAKYDEDLLLKGSQLPNSRQGPAQQEQKLVGPVVTWVSWSSERKIEYEESKKSMAQREAEAQAPPVERQLLICTDVTHPQKSSIPDIYIQSQKERRVCAQSGLQAKYIEPITHTPYATEEAFNQIRQGALRQQFAQIDQLTAKATRQLENILAAWPRLNEPLI